MMDLKITPVICSVITPAQAFKRPGFIDLRRYSGKWYVIGAIPTSFDRYWDYTTESYSIRPDGDIDIVTTYRKKGSPTFKKVRSKGFPQEHTANVTWKVQFVWPFRIDYVVEEIADDYSWVVVGHPDRKFLYIMSRHRNLDEPVFEAIIERCRRSGYDISKIRRQKQ